VQASLRLKERKVFGGQSALRLTGADSSHSALTRMYWHLGARSRFFTSSGDFSMPAVCKNLV
jgi:hypothetical protein